MRQKLADILRRLADRLDGRTTVARSIGGGGGPTEPP